MDIAIVLLPQGDVLVKLRRRSLENAVQEGPGLKAAEEEERADLVDAVVLLRGHEVVACDAVCVPARCHSHGGGSHVLRGYQRRGSLHNTSE